MRNYTIVFLLFCFISGLAGSINYVYADTLSEPIRLFGNQPLNGAAISPDGSQIVTCSNDNIVKLWDAKSGICTQIFSGHTQSVNAVSYSPDGKYILSGSNNAKLWDAASGKCLQTFDWNHEPVYSVAFSHDGSNCITGSLSGFVRMWDIATGKCMKSVGQTSSEIISFAFSPDEKQILTCHRTPYPMIWDVSSGDILRIFTGQNENVLAGCFYPDGKKVLTSSYGNVILWDSQTGVTLKSYNAGSGQIAGHSTLSFSSDGTKILTNYVNNRAALIETETGDTIRTYKGHGGSVLTAMFSSNDSMIVTASEDRSAKLWNAATGSCIQTFTEHNSRVVSAALSPDGLKALSGSWDSTAIIWDASTGMDLRKLRCASKVYSVAFSPDGKQTVTGCDNSSVKIWNANPGEDSVRYFDDPVLNVGFSSDGSKIFVTTSTAAYIWDPATNDTIKCNLPSSWSVAKFSPDGSIIASPLNHTVKLLSTETGDSIGSLIGHTANIDCIQFSSDGSKCLSGSDDKTARLWDAASGTCLQTFSGHKGGILTVAFSPSGKQVFTGSTDSTSRVWDIETGNCIRLFENYSSIVLSSAFSRDGSKILTGCFDSLARLWDAPSICTKTFRHVSSRPHTAVRIVKSTSKELTLAFPLNNAPATDAKLQIFSLDGRCIEVFPVGCSLRGSPYKTFRFSHNMSIGIYLYRLLGYLKGTPVLPGRFSITE